MQVETYECQETITEPIEASEEAIQIIRAMGLGGQESLIAPDKNDGAIQIKERCPYREMTDEEQFVFRTLCPREYNLKEYDRSPIPLRVLQVASHAESLGIFSKLVVWDKESVSEKDPVLVGHKARTTDTWRGDLRFILARWGDVLDAWPIILKRALDKKRDSLIGEYRTIHAKINARLELLTSGDPTASIMGETAPYMP